MSAPVWRLTVHRRSFATTATPSTTGVAELTDARSRRIEYGANGPAVCTFTVDGRAPAAGELVELQTEVMCWRDGRLMFRGVVAQSEDTLSEQSHSVNFTCHDYLAALTRRYLTGNADLVYTQREQDDLVADLVDRANRITSTAGTSFYPGSQLPLTVALVNPDGTARAGKSGQLRDRTYPGGTSIGQAITDLGACINGYDTDVQPAADTAGTDRLRVWYPSRGTARTTVALTYGAAGAGGINSLTRSVNSATYANYVRVIGNSGGAEGAPQLTADRWTADANDVGRVPVGLWQESDNESDVSVAATLGQKADGYLTTAGVLVPSYTLALTPGWYEPDTLGIGDTVPLVIESGRLHVNTTIRVLGISYALPDDLEAGEDVEVTVGRPALTLTALFRPLKRDIDALARR